MWSYLCSRVFPRHSRLQYGVLLLPQASRKESHVMGSLPFALVIGLKPSRYAAGSVSFLCSCVVRSKAQSAINISQCCSLDKEGFQRVATSLIFPQMTWTVIFPAKVDPFAALFSCRIFLPHMIYSCRHPNPMPIAGFQTTTFVAWLPLIPPLYRGLGFCNPAIF